MNACNSGGDMVLIVFASIGIAVVALIVGCTLGWLITRKWM